MADLTRTTHPRPKPNFVRFGPKADKRGRGWIVRFVPIATDAPQQTASLFDHLVCTAHQWERKGHSECFSRLEVDHELHFRLLFDRQFSRLGAF